MAKPVSAKKMQKLAKYGVTCLVPAIQEADEGGSPEVEAAVSCDHATALQPG